MNDTSTISWMMMGGPRDDEHSQDPRRLENQRALRESRGRGGSPDAVGSLLTRPTSIPGMRTPKAAPTLGDDGCSPA